MQLQHGSGVRLVHQAHQVMATPIPAESAGSLLKAPVAVQKIMLTCMLREAEHCD